MYYYIPASQIIITSCFWNVIIEQFDGRIYAPLNKLMSNNRRKLSNKHKVHFIATTTFKDIFTTI